ncbi:putative lysine methyltransferase, S-adenosyl-L-methionine-dependent methyltransferase [Plasmopara halstedii]
MGDDVPTSSEPLALESSFTQWARFVEMPIGNDRVVSIEQDPDSFLLGTTVWDSSKTLFKFIEQRPVQFQRYSSICELGAGCGGLAGIASAIVTKGLADVVLTDVGPVLPWLRSNVRTNLTENERQRVRVETYAWGTPVEKLRPPFDCILCADVVYEKACIKPLVQSLLALSHRKTVVFVANERRAREIRAEFMRHLDAYFHYLKVPRSELDANFLKEAIEVFEMKVKKRRIPFEMQINVPKNDEAQSNSVEKEVDHCDCDHWNDLLRDLSIDPAEKENSSNVVKR